MKKSAGRKFNWGGFFYIFLRTIGDISLVLSAVFIFMGLGSEGWDIFSSASFWTVINSTWLFAMLVFYFAERLRR